MKGIMKYLFGPVNSRRLGISLGIDLLPYKTCSLNCVYCECRGTSNLTAEIKEYVPTGEVIAELESYLSTGPELDVITFAGSGEPTLHSGIGEIIAFLKKNFPQYKITLLTNATLFWKKGVRDAVSGVDIVIPSIDAVSQDIFKQIFRPAAGINAENMVSGLTAFAKEYTGKIIAEIFIVPGLNDTEEELAKIKELCLQIEPSRVELNRLDRPGTEDWVQTAAPDNLVSIQKFLFPLEVTIAGHKKNTNKEEKNRVIIGPEEEENITDAIIATLKRRPSTLEDLTKTLNTTEDMAMKIIKKLQKKEKIDKTTSELHKGVTFYSIKPGVKDH
ncbi:MAG: radical SAM protein [bacterium]|nr:radical SAM protein [bacterium]